MDLKRRIRWLSATLLLAVAAALGLIEATTRGSTATTLLPFAGVVIEDRDGDGFFSPADGGVRTLVQMEPFELNGRRIAPALFTDDAGRFAFRCLPQGAYAARVYWSPGFVLPPSDAHYLSVPGRVDLNAGSVVQVLVAKNDPPSSPGPWRPATACGHRCPESFASPTC